MSYEKLVNCAADEIAQHHSDFVALNDDLADHPEVGTQEYETSRKMVELLRAKGFEVEYPFAGQDTAYKAVYGENNHKYKIALMAEYDALPEIGHACGHCLSGSISLLAGTALKELQDELDADIHIIGTPDEEYNGGKPKMIRAGAFDGYDFAMMIHLYDRNQAYTKVLALDTYTYYFEGQAAHASAAPWDGRNAFNASQLMFHAIDMLRQHVTPDVRIHGLIRYAGEAPNIVPEKNSVEMYIRGLEREYLDEVVRMVDDCARGAAIATQTTWSKKATAEVYDNFKRLPFGIEKLEEVYNEMGIPLNGDKEELFGSSDAGNVSFVCPTFHCTLQVVDEGVAVHTREFADAMKSDRAHEVLKTGAEVICRHVIKMVTDEENITRLKEEFEKEIEGIRMSYIMYCLPAVVALVVLVFALKLNYNKSAFIIACMAFMLMFVFLRERLTIFTLLNVMSVVTALSYIVASVLTSRKGPDDDRDKFDLMIVNGKYPDFDQNCLVEKNIGISDGKIIYIGNEQFEAEKTIDAKGKIVSPGFIDIHMHEENFAEDGERFIIADLMMKMGVTTACGGNCGMQNQRLKDFKFALKRLGGSPVNYIMLAGYNQMRYQLGLGHDEAASAKDRKELKKLLKEELEEGAAGISFGIEYDQGITTEDMLEALMLLKNERYIASAHFRKSDGGALASIDEMAELAKKSGVKFQISHLGSCSAAGYMEESLAKINQYMEEIPGLNYDTYPYNAFSTLIGSAVFEKESMAGWCDDIGKIMLTQDPYKNVYLTEDILKDARENYPEMMAVGFTMKEEEVAAAITNPNGMIGSDAILNKGKGHPRAAGTFPRVLGKYVREEQQLPLIDALRKMTSEPAKRLSLGTKGCIKAGFDGDITIFDPETIMDGATYDNIYVQPEGIDYVIINGQIAMNHKQVENDRLGKFIAFRK